MNSDQDKFTARIWLHAGKKCAPATMLVTEGEETTEFTIGPGEMNGLNLDVGDELVLRYTKEGRLEIESVKNGGEGP